MKASRHIISLVDEGSIAWELGIEKGDELLKINNNEIEDIFDYQYLIQDEYIEVLIKKADGEEWLLEIDKEYSEDLGLTFENGLMDEYRSCHNKCIFCFHCCYRSNWLLWNILLFKTGSKIEWRRKRTCYWNMWIRLYV